MGDKKFVLIEYIFYALGFAIVILSGLRQDLFQVNSNSILVYFIISFTLIAKYFSSPTTKEGIGLVDKEVKQVKELLNQSVTKLNDAHSKGKKGKVFEMFQLQEINEKLKKDVAVAIAFIRIEIENKLKAANEYFGLTTGSRYSDVKIVKQLRAKKVITGEQADFLISLIDLCDKAINGASISKHEARQIVNSIQRFNSSFEEGYSISFEPNEKFKSQELICEWAHCVKLMPLKKNREICFCPRLGYDCPGGKKKVFECNKSLVDIPNNVLVEFVQTSLFDKAKN